MRFLLLVASVAFLDLRFPPSEPLFIITKEDLYGQETTVTHLETLRNRVEHLHLLVAQLPSIQLKVGLDALRRDTLGDHTPALLQPPGEKTLLHRFALGVRNFLELLVLVQRRVGAAETGVAGGVDALGGVKGDELGGRVARVQLDLVDGGDHLALFVGEQLLEILDAKVGDADIAHLASADQLLHLAPGISEVPVRVVLLLVVGIRRRRPVHQEQIKVIRLKGFQRRSQTLGDVLVPWVVKLGGQPDVLARHARGLDAGANLLLVAVGVGSVDVAVACAEGGFDSGGNFVGLGLPGAEADGGDLVARVKEDGAAVGGQ